jgi:photosystem II stability/assembly factor-like uncharacterized protein
MTIFTRRRVIAIGLVASFVAAFAAIGAVSRSSPKAAAPVVGAAGVPFSPWYWTMAVSPADANVLVLATSSGLFRSEDGGKTWKATGPKGLNATSLAQSGDSLFAGGVSGAGPNPVIRKGTGRTAPDGPAALVVSTDDGKTWQKLDPSGLPKVTVQALAVDPASSGSLYALLNDGRLYRSTDGGGSFALVSPKLGVAPWAFAITKDNGFVAGDMDSGPFRGTSAGAWKKTAFSDGKGGSMVMEYAVHPTDFARVLMSSYGVVISTDGGTTWHRSLKSDVMFGPVAWAPDKGEIAYAVGFDRSLWRSDDGGKTWTKVS